MTDVGFRELGTIVPGLRVAEAPPSLPNVGPIVGAAGPQSPPAGPPRTFAADTAHGVDGLNRDAPLALLADLALHSGTETPLCIGLLGRPGSGKSFALTRLVGAIEGLSAAAASLERSPFVAKIFTRRIDAAALEGDPAIALAAELHTGLAKTYPDLAREATHAVRDPHVVAREASERLDEARRRLDAERRALDDIDSRRARLTETVLYDTAGSQVDAYARANRARIESRLESFGVTGEPIRNYKDMVRTIAESGGGGARIGIALRAFWAFSGQTRLIITAVFLLLVGLGLEWAVANQATWLTSLRSGQESLVPVATWFQAHMNWLVALKHLAWIGAALAVLANIWRGVRFLQPMFRGVSLLRNDIAGRRRDLDAGLAHQTRRVDGLGADVDLATRRAAEAEQRANSVGPMSASAEPPPFEINPARAQAKSFIASLGRSVKEPARTTSSGPAAAPGPQRMFVAIDNLDSLAPARAREVLDAAHRLFAGTFVTLVAVDLDRLARNADESSQLEKWIQVPFRLDHEAETGDYGGLVRAVLGQNGHGVPASAQPAFDGRKSALDLPVSDAEIEMLSGLVPLAGKSPRAAKRFVNLYRIARHATPDHPAATAMMLALDSGGTQAEIDGTRTAIATDAAHVDLGLVSPRLAHVQRMVEMMGGPLSAATVRQAAAIAAPYSLRTRAA